MFICFQNVNQNTFFDDLILSDKSWALLPDDQGIIFTVFLCFEVSLKMAAFEPFLTIAMCLTAQVTRHM